MSVGQLCHYASAGGTLDESLHDKEGFVDLLYRSAVFSDGRCNGGDTHRTAFELVDDGEQNLVVYLVEAILVDVECRKSEACDADVDASVALYLCEISDTAQ